MLAAAAEPRLCLLVGATRFKTPQKDCITPPKLCTHLLARICDLLMKSMCRLLCTEIFSSSFISKNGFSRCMWSVRVRAWPCERCWPVQTRFWAAWMLSAVLLLDPTYTEMNTDRPPQRSERSRSWTQGCLTACLCFVSVSQALWDTEFCSIKAFSEPRGISVTLSHSLDADSSLDVEIFLFFSYSSPPFTQTPWSWCPRPPSSGALHVKAFMTLFYLYIFWKLHLNIFQKQRALIKSRLYISFIAAPSISESQWLEKSNSLFTLPSSPWQIEVQFAALWQRPLSPKIAPINFCTVLLPITWSGA